MNIAASIGVPASCDTSSREATSVCTRMLPPGTRREASSAAKASLTMRRFLCLAFHQGSGK